LTEPTIAEDVLVFLRSAGARSGHTERTYRSALEHFLAYLATRGLVPNAPASDLTMDHGRDFAAWLARDYRTGDGAPLAASSRALYLVALSRFYRYLMVAKRLPAEPGDYEALKDDLARLERVEDDPIERKLPEDQVVAALIATARRAPELNGGGESERRRELLAWRRDLAAVLALASSGMRAGELVALRRGDLVAADHGAYVRGKGSKMRFVRLSREAWAALTAYQAEAWLPDGGTPAARSDVPVFCRHDRGAGDRRLPISTRTLQEIVARLARRAGISETFHMHPHSLRHFFATKLLGDTHDLALVQDALGHADPGTTRVYTKTQRKDLVAAHKAAFDQQKALPGFEEEGEPA